MKYCIITLSIGEKYIEMAVNMFKSFKEKTEHCDFVITTMEPREYDENDFIIWKYIHPPFDVKGPGGNFYYNLKSLAFRSVIDLNDNNGNLYDYVVFLDADMFMYEKFREENFLNLFDYMEQNDVDMIFERPAKISSHKDNLDRCFFKQKLTHYYADRHTKWDEGYVMNEQFLIVKYNWKYIFFTIRWEQMLWYSIRHHIINFAEGFEMGISALEADMKMVSVEEIKDMVHDIFYFFDHNGKMFIRYQ